MGTGSLSNNSPTQESKEWSGGCQGPGVEGNGKLLTNGYEISVMPQEYILEMCCTARCLWITILYCTWGKKKIGEGARSHFKRSFHNSKRKKKSNNSIIYFFFGDGGFPDGSVVKNLPATQEMWVQSVGRADPLEEGMAPHSSILAWRIPWTEEPGGLQSTGSQRVRHD